MNQLQTVLDALQEHARYAGPKTVEAIAIVKQMMQAEPVAWRKRRDDVLGWALLHQSVGWKDTTGIEPLYAAPQAVPAWLPIESAPKDELILVGPTKRMGICAAMNHSRDGWVTETCGEWSIIYTPTHWMPLPSAPKGAV